MPRIAVALASMSAFALTAAASGQTQYSIKRAGPVPGDLGSFGCAINIAGQATGWSTGSGADHAYFYDNGTALALPNLGTPYSSGRGISPSGDVVGLSATSGFPFYQERAALWTRDNSGSWQVTNLGLLPVHAHMLSSYSVAAATNGTGLIAGASADGYNTDLAVVWELDNSQDPPRWVINELPGAPGAFYTVAADVNTAGQVVGRSDGAALLWTKNENGTWVAAALGGLAGGDGWADARAINADGVIVGQAGAPDGLRHAVRWEDSGAVDLGPEGIESQANAVNASGVIVGMSGVSVDSDALRWTGNAVADLEDLIPPGTGWDLREATGINDSGQIVGTGTLGGYFHTFLLTPMELGLAGPTPGVAGTANTFAVKGAGGAGWTLWYSFTGGETALGGCGDIPLNLGSPGALAVAAPGVTSVSVTIPAKWRGQTVYFQVSRASGCAVSNVISYTFP